MLRMLGPGPLTAPDNMGSVDALIRKTHLRALFTLNFFFGFSHPPKGTECLGLQRLGQNRYRVGAGGIYLSPSVWISKDTVDFYLQSIQN